jgi:hypothetical protein
MNCGDLFAGSEILEKNNIQLVSTYVLDNKAYIGNEAGIANMGTAPFQPEEIDVAAFMADHADEDRIYHYQDRDNELYRLGHVDEAEFKKEYRQKYKLIDRILRENGIDMSNPGSFAAKFPDPGSARKLADAFNRLISIPNLIELLDRDEDPPELLSSAEHYFANRQKLARIYPHSMTAHVPSLVEGSLLVDAALKKNGVDTADPKTVTAAGIAAAFNQVIADPGFYLIVENVPEQDRKQEAADPETVIQNKNSLARLYLRTLFKTRPCHLVGDDGRSYSLQFDDLEPRLHRGVSFFEQEHWPSYRLSGAKAALPRGHFIYFAKDGGRNKVSLTWRSAKAVRAGNSDHALFRVPGIAYPLFLDYTVTNSYTTGVTAGIVNANGKKEILVSGILNTDGVTAFQWKNHPIGPIEGTLEIADGDKKELWIVFNCPENYCYTLLQYSPAGPFSDRRFIYSSTDLKTNADQ